MSGDASFFRSTAAQIARAAYYAEFGLIVQPIEMIRRAWHHIDPRVYSERRRIRKITDGRIPKKSNRYVLFLLFTKYEVPPFTHTVLEAINRRGLNLVVVSNDKMSEPLREQILGKCHILIERNNVGRDFGGYKDGLSALSQRTNDIGRLIILNDSLFFFDKNIDDLIDGLDGDQPVIGMTEDFERHYHIQSFALSISGDVLADERIRNYWRNYRPIGTRRWVVIRGERGLTRQLVRCGFKPHILYHGAKLLPALRAFNLSELIAAVELMPARIRDRLYDQFKSAGNVYSSGIPAMETLAKTARRLDRLSENTSDATLTTTVGQMLTIGEQIARLHSEREQQATSKLCDLIVSNITDGNQIHIGGFLFMKFLGMPAFKRDVFFREVYEIEEIAEIMAQLDLPMREEIIGDLRQKGTARLLYGLSRILYRHGAI